MVFLLLGFSSILPVVFIANQLDNRCEEKLGFLHICSLMFSLIIRVLFVCVPILIGIQAIIIYFSFLREIYFIIPWNKVEGWHVLMYAYGDAAGVFNQIYLNIEQPLVYILNKFLYFTKEFF